MVLAVESAFLIFGGVLFIGYFGEMLSRRFAVPSALLLLIIGYLLRFSGYIDVQSLVRIQGLFGSLALVVLLFDGGLSLNLHQVVFKSGRVLLMSVLTTVFALIGSVFLFMVFGLNPIIGAIIGAVAGGIGSTTTISILKGIELSDKIKNFLTLESSITDVFSIILAIVLTQTLISGTIDIQIIGQGIVSKFSVGIFSGIIIGVLSIIALTKIEKGYNYMIMFALVLILFAVTEFLGGSGAIAVLIFGIVFGNESAIRKIIKSDHTKKCYLTKEFQVEISFFVRTFFFVFLGIIVELGSLTNLLIAFLLVFLYIIIRYVSIHFSTANSPLYDSRFILTAVCPRGLATAVLAAYPVVTIQNLLKTSSDPYLKDLLLQVASLPEISFYIIILSIVVTTFLVPYVMHKNSKA